MHVSAKQFYPTFRHKTWKGEKIILTIFSVRKANQPVFVTFKVSRSGSVFHKQMKANTIVGPSYYLWTIGMLKTKGVLTEGPLDNDAVSSIINLIIDIIVIYIYILINGIRSLLYELEVMYIGIFTTTTFHSLFPPHWGYWLCTLDSACVQRRQLHVSARLLRKVRFT